jgi:hypothetical protein
VDILALTYSKNYFFYFDTLVAWNQIREAKNAK